MASIHEMPAVRLVIPLGIGIAIADYFEVPLNCCLPPFIFLTAFLALTSYFTRSYQFILYSNFLIPLLLICGGASCIRFCDELSKVEEIPTFKNYNFEGLVEDLKKKKGNYSCTFVINKYFDKDSTYTRSFKSKLHISNYPQELRNGDIVIVNGMLTPIYKNKNPHTFDYKNYLRHHQIFHQVYVDSSKVLSHKKSNKLLLLPIQFNNYAQQILKNNLSPENAGVAIGMITGSKNDIPTELLNTYSKVGVMHLLAVSGLHVGIISELLFFLFGQRKKQRKKKIAVVFIIIGIWLFVLFTGSSASTVRAGLMFTLLNYARVSDKLYNPFNAVACSAFLLLVINPHYLFDLGFQLSYLAVISIIFFYPIIDNFADMRHANKLVRYVWQLFVLSLSANILIMPLTIYYFNQVPLTFPITNIIAVPAAACIVIGGLALIGIELVMPFINEYYSMIYEIGIEFVNYFLRYMEQIPYSIQENIYINTTQLVMIYLSLLILMAMLVRNNISYLKYILASVLSLIVYDSYLTHKSTSESKFTAYDVYNKTAVDFTIGDRTYFYTSDSLTKSSLNFNLLPNRLATKNKYTTELGNLKEIHNTDIRKQESLLIFGDKLFFTPRSRRELENIPKEVDYVIVEHTFGLEGLDISPHTLVILRNDKYLNKWRPNIPEHQIIRISKHGAYTKILNDV